MLTDDLPYGRPISHFLFRQLVVNQIAPSEAKTISTPKLGRVGGRIVAEVLLGLMFGDNNSYFNQEPDWTPTIASDFRLKDFVKYALGM